ncbi:ABC transporter ATP-binding protein [Streptomyces sp. NPDC127051]|uniref:ABC transporter ATP-binding protein n=1 Tax=Streptomyces sp. NPDC127051 TaxID=3347119 RepID=UPI0036534A44
MLLALGFAGGVLALVGNACQRLLRLAIEQDAMERVVSAAAAAELAEFENPAFHDRVQRAVQAAQVHAPVLLVMLVMAIRSVLAVVAVGAGLAVMAWWLLPVLVIASVPYVRLGLSQQRAQYRLERKLTENQRSRRYLAALLTGRDEAKEIRAFDLARTFWDRLADCYRQAMAEHRSLQLRYLWLGIAARLAGDAVAGAAVAVVVIAATTGRLDAASALTVLGGLYIAARQTTGVAGTLTAMGSSALFLQDLRGFTHSASRRPPPPRPPGKPFTELSAQNVSFTYPAQSEPALRDISVQLKAGQTIALVGENGSGKTTLAKILTGLYQPDTGEIYIDDEKVTDPGRLRAGSSVLFQDFLRYKLTAGENIALGSPRHLHDTQRITHAARQAGAAPIAAALPEGYATLLGTEFTGGTDLSAGQWQRIALARAFFRDSPFVVLDEPTAAMDPHAEADLFTRMQELFAGRTVLLISHRLSSVTTADRVYVLQHGTIIDEGIHQQLLDSGGAYARMFHTQAAPYLNASTTQPSQPNQDNEDAPGSSQAQPSSRPG